MSLKKCLPVLLSVVCGSAGAEPLYQDFVFTGYQYRLPEVEATLVDNNLPFGASPDSVTGIGAYYRVAFAAPSAPVLVGTEPALELGLRLNAGDEDERRASPTSAFGFMPVDGSGTSVGDGGVPELGYEADVTDLSLEGLVVTALAERGGFARRFAWGLAWRRLTVEHGFFGYTASGDRLTQASVEDEVVTDYLGAVAELRLVRPLSPRWRLWAHARGELGFAMADLDVDQRLGDRYAAADSDSGFAPAAGVGAGVSGKFANLMLGLQLSADYLGYLATVEHPLYDSRPFESRLKKDSMTVIGAGLTAALVF